MKSFQELQREVGSWSEGNFGKQESHVMRVALNSLAPLMGMCEEFGELVDSESEDKIRDAVADIAIYACDYAYRESMVIPFGIKFKGIKAIDAFKDPTIGIISSIAKLQRITLKRHQGIRGYDNDEKYQTDRGQYMYELFAYLHSFCVASNMDLLQILNKTWNENVSKRDWNESPEDGGESKNVPLSEKDPGPKLFEAGQNLHSSEGEPFARIVTVENNMTNTRLDLGWHYVLEQNGRFERMRQDDLVKLGVKIVKKDEED